MLYRIEGTGVKIAGATSAAPAAGAAVPGWLRRVFDGADQMVFAADTEGIDPAAYLLPAHQSLTVLSFFDGVSALWKRLEIAGSAARSKPWVVSARLRAGLAKHPAPGAAATLLAEARNRRTPPRFLETPAEWLASFDTVPLEEQLDELERVAAAPDAVAAYETALRQFWLAHDLKAMGELLETERRREPGFGRRSLDERNGRWLPRLKEILAENATARRALDTLVVVDAPHLCGAQGLVALLTGEGRTLTRLL